MYVYTRVPRYPGALKAPRNCTLVRYAGTCSLASLRWGRWPQVPASHCPRHGFLGLAVAVPAASPSRPSRPHNGPGALGDCDCSDTVKQPSSFIRPCLHPTVTTVAQCRRKRNRFRPLNHHTTESRSQRFSLGVLFSRLACFDSFVTIASCDSAARVTWPVGLLSRWRKDCNVTAPPTPQGMEENFCSRPGPARKRAWPRG